MAARCESSGLKTQHRNNSVLRPNERLLLVVRCRQVKSRAPLLVSLRLPRKSLQKPRLLELLVESLAALRFRLPVQRREPLLAVFRLEQLPVPPLAYSRQLSLTPWLQGSTESSVRTTKLRLRLSKT